jgi:hypothetical protein
MQNNSSTNLSRWRSDSSGRRGSVLPSDEQLAGNFGVGSSLISFQVSAPLFGKNGHPAYGDVRQGFLGDCYLMAALAAVAAKNPQCIMEMVKPAAGGRYTARLSEDVSVGPVIPGVKRFVDVPNHGQVLLTKSLVADAAPASWVALLEKAVAKIHKEKSPSYQSLNGGNPRDAFKLMGIPGESFDRYASSREYHANIWLGILDKHLDGNGAVVIGTGKSVNSKKFTCLHGYAVLGKRSTQSGTGYLLYDPGKRDVAYASSDDIVRDFPILATSGDLQERVNYLSGRKWMKSAYVVTAARMAIPGASESAQGSTRANQISRNAVQAHLPSPGLGR